MVEQPSPGVYRIPVPLPGNPLKSLNAYMLHGGGRPLLIDTGFNRPECLAALQAGLAELGLAPGGFDIFITHFHADHCGLVPQLTGPGARVYMARNEHEKCCEMILDSELYWSRMTDIFAAEGYPQEELAATQQNNPARLYVASATFEAEHPADGDVLEAGGMRLRVVATPGHTPGHLCLYDEAHGRFFSGDHILFDITPNITSWPEMPNSLAVYLESLKAVRGLPVRECFTAHRENSGQFLPRINALMVHHEERLADALRIVAESPGISGYTAASRMAWSIRVKSWAEFPPGQRWFAVGEALSHLRLLQARGLIRREEHGGIGRYTATTNPAN